MDEASRTLARNLAALTQARKKRPTRALTTDRTLQALAADLVGARVAAGMTQEGVGTQQMRDALVVALRPPA